MTYKIDEIDKTILFELDKNSRIPEVQLAKKINKSKEAVRYRIKKLIENNIILGFTTWIDPLKLGFQTGKIYLTLANIPNERKRFIEYIKKDKRLFWLGIAEGAWNAGLTFFVKTNEEFFELKNEIFTKFRDLIIDNKVGEVVSIYFHGMTFLHADKQDCLKEMFDKSENIEIDQITKNILKELLEDSRVNIASIAFKYNTTVDIVRNRLRKLESDEIIKKYTIKLNYQELGYEFYKTFLYFKSLDKLEITRLKQYILNNKNIIHMVKQISPWDIELETMCSSYKEYNNIISQLSADFSDILIKTETAIMGEDYVFPSKKLVFE